MNLINSASSSLQSLQPRSAKIGLIITAKKRPVSRRGKGTDTSVLRIKPSDLPRGAASEERVREKRQRQAAFGQISEKMALHKKVTK
jgi:hypothetical protein